MVVLSSNQTIYYSQSKEYKQLLAIICIFTNISLLVLEGKANNCLYIITADLSCNENFICNCFVLLSYKCQ